MVFVLRFQMDDLVIRNWILLILGLFYLGILREIRLRMICIIIKGLLWIIALHVLDFFIILLVCNLYLYVMDQIKVEQDLIIL